MDIFGNQEGLNVHGDIHRDAFGNPEVTNVFGNQPADAWGNPSVGHADGGLLDTAMDFLSGLFGG